MPEEENGNTPEPVKEANPKPSKAQGQAPRLTPEEIEPRYQEHLRRVQEGR